MVRSQEIHFSLSCYGQSSNVSTWLDGPCYLVPFFLLFNVTGTHFLQPAFRKEIENIYQHNEIPWLCILTGIIL